MTEVQPLPPHGFMTDEEMNPAPKAPKAPKETVDELARVMISQLSDKTFDAITQLASVLTHVPAIEVGSVRVPPISIPAPVIKVMPVTEWDFTIERDTNGRISKVKAKAK